MVRNKPRIAATLLVPAACLIVMVLAFAVGRLAGASQRTVTVTAAAAIQWRSGIPVGVQNSQAGALAAADNYVLVEENTIESNPARYAKLIATVDAPDYRDTATTTGIELRQGHPDAVQNFAAGGRGLAVIAADKLDYYAHGQAQVTAWVGGIAWGAGFTGQRSWGWAFETVTMRWWAGQWWVAADRGESGPPNPTSDWLNAHLTGFQTMQVR